MILIIDNYDSFTYNLVQLIATGTSEYHVVRNDMITVNEISAMRPDGILISPGPGRPETAGICVQLIRELGENIPILGVCLGHQAIGHAFGGSVVHAPALMHGKTSTILHEGDALYASIPHQFKATRYHSLVISPETFPNDLTVTAKTVDGIIMGVRHRRYPMHGIQFHPESILTEVGPQLIRNWMKSLKVIV